MKNGVLTRPVRYVTRAYRRFSDPGLLDQNDQSSTPCSLFSEARRSQHRSVTV